MVKVNVRAPVHLGSGYFPSPIAGGDVQFHTMPVLQHGCQLRHRKNEPGVNANTAKSLIEWQNLVCSQSRIDPGWISDYPMIDGAVVSPKRAAQPRLSGWGSCQSYKA